MSLPRLDLPVRAGPSLIPIRLLLVAIWSLKPSIQGVLGLENVVHRDRSYVSFRVLKFTPAVAS
jgi:hypothetical protein